MRPTEDTPENGMVSASSTPPGASAQPASAAAQSRSSALSARVSPASQRILCGKLVNVRARAFGA